MNRNSIAHYFDSSDNLILLHNSKVLILIS